MSRRRHDEGHKTSQLGWLRAAVLGANDGLLSTSSLVIGVAAASATRSAILIAGVAGLIGGAMSMAAGEYVSVSSQHDAEKADLDRERKELSRDPEAERAELAGIYVERGLEPDLAKQVARQLMAKDALAAHARDELGLSDETAARPLQAALASAAAFALGALPPLAVALTVAQGLIAPFIAGTSVLVLALLGGIGAAIGGAKIWVAVVRVTFWGVIAMAVTAVIGHLFGARL